MSIVPGSTERLNEYFRVFRSLKDNDERDTARAMLVGALAHHIENDRWLSCLETVTRLLAKREAA